MEHVILIDGIGDFSIAKELKSNIPNNSFLILGHILKELKFTIEYIDGRSDDFTKEDLVVNLNRNKNVKIILNIQWNNYREIIRYFENSSISANEIYYYYDNPVIKSLLLDENVEKRKMIFFDETKPYQENYEFFLQNYFGYDGNFIFKYSPQYWDILKQEILYSYEITVGTGCNKKGLYFPYNNSSCTYFEIENVIEEIRYLLNIGVKHIHIKNLNLGNNQEYIRNLTHAIKNNFNKDNFTMSCVLCPQDIINNPQILDNLKETQKIIRIEFQVNSIDKNIQKHYKNKFTENELFKILQKTFELDFTSIAVNYVIGTVYETSKKLNNLKKFSKKLIELLPGKIEFSLDYYYERELNMVDHRQKSLIYRGFLLKYNDKISVEILNNFKSAFYSEMTDELKKSLKKMNVIQRTNHTILANNGLLTQYYYWFLSKSTAESVRVLKIQNRNWKNSWEISDDIFDYTPAILMKLYYIDNKRILFFDSLITESNNQHIELSDFEFFLYQQSRGFKKLNEIYRTVIDSFKDSSNDVLKRNILDFFLKLEKLDLVLFTKLLN
jgi:hypothetical protein